MHLYTEPSRTQVRWSSRAAVPGTGAAGWHSAADCAGPRHDRAPAPASAAAADDDAADGYAADAAYDAAVDADASSSLSSDSSGRARWGAVLLKSVLVIPTRVPILSCIL